MLVDSNVLIYAAYTRARHHDVAKRWLESALSGSDPVLFTWVSLLGFVRISTNRSAFVSPLSTTRAFEYVDEWLAAPPATIAEPGARHGTLLKQLLSPIGSAGNLTTDAHLAAIAVEHGVPIVSFDNDFDRFEAVERLQPGN